MTTGINNTFDYIDNHSFSKMEFDKPECIEISGKQFAIARVSNYAACKSYDALVKFIEEKGGTVKDNAVRSADYLIITPSPTSQMNFTYKAETDKYEKALGYRRSSGKPFIIRDIDFYIINDLFSKLTIDDKRRVAIEYLYGNSYFTEKAAKKVVSFISQKGQSEQYLKSNDSVLKFLAKQAE